MSLQSIAPSFRWVLKFDPKQPRHPKGSGEGGRFARSAEVTQAHEVLLAEARRVAPGITERSIAQRAEMKKHIQMDLADRLRKHPAFQGMEPRPPIFLEPVAEWVKQKIDLWAESSGDSEPAAIAMQEAVRREFNLRHVAMDHLVADYPLLDIDSVDEARCMAFVRAEYERTQEFLEAQGITHVSVFRGMSALGADLGYEDREGHMGIEVVTMQPASSWTTKLRTAYDFAQTKPQPVVLTTRVPASQVLSTCVTGRGCLSEYEVILLGKEQRIRTFNVYNEETNEKEQNFLENIEQTLQR